MGYSVHWWIKSSANNYVAKDLTSGMRYGVIEFANLCYLFINFVRPTTDWTVRGSNPH